MDLTDLEGQRFGPHPFHIGRSAVGDFIDITNDDSDRWKASAPPGFIAAALFVVAPDLLGQLADRSILHGEQSFAWDGPLLLGSSLSVTGEVSRVRERGGVHFVGFDIEVAGEARVARGGSMFLVSGDSTATQFEERSEPEVLADGDPEPGQVSMSRLDLVRYAAATRDFNPIHWDHQSAIDAGLPGVVVHGLAQASWALAAAARHRDGDRPLASAKIRFRNPLLPAVPVFVRDEISETVVNLTVTDGEIEYVSARVNLADG